MSTTYPVSIAEMCERYKKLYTGAIGDILDKRGYRNQILPYYINPIRVDMMIAGPAFTGYGEPHNDPTDYSRHHPCLPKHTSACIRHGLSRRVPPFEN